MGNNRPFRDIGGTEMTKSTGLLMEAEIISIRSERQSPELLI